MIFLPLVNTGHVCIYDSILECMLVIGHIDQLLSLPHLFVHFSAVANYSGQLIDRFRTYLLTTVSIQSTMSVFKR